MAEPDFVAKPSFAIDVTGMSKTEADSKFRRKQLRHVGEILESVIRACQMALADAGHSSRTEADGLSIIVWVGTHPVFRATWEGEIGTPDVRIEGFWLVDPDEIGSEGDW